MKYLDEKKKIIELGKRLVDERLTRGTGGNLSYFDHASGIMIITPSGIDYHQTKVEDLVIMDIDLNVIEGERKPSSEYQMHLELYKRRPEFNAMIHTHSTFATTLSVLNKPLLAVDYLVAMGGGKDVRIAEYASFGTIQLANNALKAMTDRNAVLLANHGINVASTDLEDAFSKLEILEFCCELYIRALSAGEPVILSDDEMLQIKKDFKTYGQ